MTIFKLFNLKNSHIGEKKSEWQPVKPATNDNVVVLLAQIELGKEDEAASADSIKIVENNTKGLERCFQKVCKCAAILAIFIFSACLGYFIHRKFFNCEPVVETIHVQFHEHRHHVDNGDVVDSRIEGGFYEQVEIVWRKEKYEKMSIPPFIDVRRATILHDFGSNFTCIVDHDTTRCFIIPLNQTVINPPLRFLEHINSLKAGHGFPKARVERQLHRVITPPVDNMLNFKSSLILSDCQYYDTYRLVKVADEPTAMSKRIDCQFAGDTYSLGETGSPYMVLITLDGCVRS